MSFNDLTKISISNRKLINRIKNDKVTAEFLWKQIYNSSPPFELWGVNVDKVYSNMLFLIHKDQLHSGKSKDMFSYQLATKTMFFADFKCRGATKNNFFIRHELLCSVEIPEVFKSHSLRHLLNTFAQQSFLSDFEIALWSGRKRIQQNAVYDNRTAEEMRDNDRRVLLPNEPFFEIPNESTLTKLIYHRNSLGDVISGGDFDEKTKEELIFFNNDLNVLIDYLINEEGFNG